jgi:hypothetical protein
LTKHSTSAAETILSLRLHSPTESRDFATEENDMKKFIWAATMLMVAGLAVPAIAGNVENGNEKISIGFYFPATGQGIFSIVGGGDPRGTAEVTSRAPYVDSDGSPRIKLTKTLHFADGDVLLSTDGTFVASATLIQSSGTWLLTGGTGIYVNVTGGGNYHWCRTVATGNLVGAYSGKMKLDGDEDRFTTRADRVH